MSSSPTFLKIKDTLARVGINGFFVGLVAVVLLAANFPTFGSEAGPFPWQTLIAFGNAFIFFFYGVKMHPQKLKAGLGNWRLHILIQTTTFLLFPLVIWATYLLMGSPDSELWLGVFFFAALPSTVSSSVVMVSIAGGNIPAAIFNASVSSIIGIFITPVWMELFMETDAVSFNLLPTFLKLFTQVLLPVIVGFLLHKRLGDWAMRNNLRLRKFDQGIILMIVFTSFSSSFEQRMFEGLSAQFLLLLALAMLVFFLAMAVGMYYSAKGLKFSIEDRITVLFCGSKKSLVHGAVMGNVLFPDPTVLGLILLPLMIYHTLQLVAGSILAQQFSRKILMAGKT
jgi:solute carrier family 10 (sodium/bile acid cotransporter), member 7